jgi:hypothetical protein
MTRPFANWPRWAVDALRWVLVRVDVLPDVLFELDLEVYGRDTVDFQDDETVDSWPCPGPEGLQ